MYEYHNLHRYGWDIIYLFTKPRKPKQAKTTAKRYMIAFKDFGLIPNYFEGGWIVWSNL